MGGILTEIALQLKGNLAFLLGLGGMFAIAKGLFAGLLVLPDVEKKRPALKADAMRIKRRLIALAGGSIVLFLIALGLYLGPMASIDSEAMRKTGAQLTSGQALATAVLSGVAVLMVIAESASSVLRYKMTLIASRT